MKQYAKALELLNNAMPKLHAVAKVLFEKETSPQWHQGHAPNYVKVKIPRDSEDVSLRRQLLKVEITSSDGEFCYGKLI